MGLIVFSYFTRLLDTRTLSPHGFCLLWRPELLWTHVVSDSLIFLAYMSIPVALAVIIARRRDVPFGWMVGCFALFITACGFTHLMAVWTLWRPDYGVEAIFKLVTAAASVGTAVALWRLIPVIVALPSPAQLRAVNAELLQRVAERDLAIGELQHERGQRLRSEEALVQSRKMDALGQLTGGIAHDFNNLLQAVQGSLELIKRRAADVVAVQQLAEGGLQATERGGRLTAQLLAFARSKQLKTEAFEVSDFILGMRDLLGRAAGELIDLRFDLAAEGASVRADRTQLELAVLNLVINARDATPAGGRITVATALARVGREDPEISAGAYVVLSVADTGAGMTAEVRARAFDPFFSTKGVGAGTGLGLSQVYGVARQAGGAARIESAPGAGTTVRLFLPVAETPAIAAPDSRPALRARGLKGLVLMADDDADVRGFAAAALESMGLTVLATSDGPAAVAAFRDRVPDLALLDYAMPGMNGAEVARVIAGERPDLPIVFMTGYADAESLETVLGRGAAVLRKPFLIDELGAIVERALARSRVLDAP